MQPPSDHPLLPRCASQGVQLHRFRPEQEASVVLPLQPGNYEVREGSLRFRLTAPMHHAFKRAQSQHHSLWCRPAARLPGLEAELI